MTIPPKISLVTLGVRDVEAATAFYEQLGWRLSSASVPGDVSFFHTAGGILALWGHDELAADAEVEAEPAPRFRGVALAINVASSDEVDAALAAAAAAGGTVVKPARLVEWGGYSGYFADPEGHLWEVAHNPGWPLGDDGLPILP
jgi:uncharacterized protein